MTVDDQTIERAVPIQKVVFLRVNAGQHTIVLNATGMKSKAIRAEDLVSV